MPSVIIRIKHNSLSAPYGLYPEDSTWIGAWWLGFVVIGILTIVPSLMLCFFPAGDEKFVFFM